jgi:hypothetical protein
MRKIAAIKVEYNYIEASDSQERVGRFYSWLINRAIDNLLNKQRIDNNSTQKYTKDNG